LFTSDIEYDVTDLGGGVLKGIAAIRDAALALGNLNPVGHHVTNIVVEKLEELQASARCKGIGVNADRTTGSVTYVDTLLRTDQGWRIKHRRVLGRKIPLNAKV